MAEDEEEKERHRDFPLHPKSKSEISSTKMQRQRLCSSPAQNTPKEKTREFNQEKQCFLGFS